MTTFSVSSLIPHFSRRILQPCASSNLLLHNQLQEGGLSRSELFAGAHFNTCSDKSLTYQIISLGTSLHQIFGQSTRARVVGREYILHHSNQRTMTRCHREKSVGKTTEDAVYITKLCLGCISGAAVIKYGSILLPSLTHPDLIEAILMIFIPVFTATVLLLAASLKEKGIGE